MNTRLFLIPLVITLAAAPASAGHRQQGSDSSIILQNNARAGGSNDNGGIILQNNDKSKAVKNRGGIILQNQNRGGIILQDQNRGGIILQDSGKAATQNPG